MSNFSALKTAVQQVIKQNGNEEITGAILQEILLSIINTLGDSAINNLETALQTETTNRTNADGTLQQNINTEATTRGEADTALGNLIGAEETARENADTALQGAITAINARLNEGYLYKGIATPTTDPSTPTGRLFYIATAAGTYTNFLDANSQPLVVTKGINILKYNGSWEVQQVVGIDETPTVGSHNLVESGGVQNELALGAVYDVSAHNNNTTFESLSALLSDANLNTLIPTSVRRGGMSIKFVQTSDNNYIQFRCMAQNFTTTVGDWQGVDDEPTAGSENLVNSDGVFKFKNTTYPIAKYLALNEAGIFNLQYLPIALLSIKLIDNNVEYPNQLYLTTCGARNNGSQVNVEICDSNGTVLYAKQQSISSSNPITKIIIKNFIFTFDTKVLIETSTASSSYGSYGLTLPLDITKIISYGDYENIQYEYLSFSDIGKGINVNNGNIVNAPNECCTGKLPISLYTKAVNFESNGGSNVLAFYNNLGTKISIQSSLGLINIPEGAAYIAASTLIANSSKLTLINDLSVTEKIMEEYVPKDIFQDVHKVKFSPFDTAYINKIGGVILTDRNGLDNCISVPLYLGDKTTIRMEVEFPEDVHNVSQNAEIIRITNSSDYGRVILRKALTTFNSDTLLSLPVPTYNAGIFTGSGGSLVGIVADGFNRELLLGPDTMAFRFKGDCTVAENQDICIEITTTSARVYHSTNDATIAEYSFTTYPTLRELYEAIAADCATGESLEDFEIKFLTLDNLNSTDLIPGKARLVSQYNSSSIAAGTFWDAFPFYFTAKEKGRIYTIEILIDTTCSVPNQAIVDGYGIVFGRFTTDIFSNTDATIKFNDQSVNAGIKIHSIEIVRNEAKSVYPLAKVVYAEGVYDGLTENRDLVASEEKMAGTFQLYKDANYKSVGFNKILDLAEGKRLCDERVFHVSHDDHAINVLTDQILREAYLRNDIVPSFGIELTETITQEQKSWIDALHGIGFYYFIHIGVTYVRGKDIGNLSYNELSTLVDDSITAFIQTYGYYPICWDYHRTTENYNVSRYLKNKGFKLIFGSTGNGGVNAINRYHCKRSTTRDTTSYDSLIATLDNYLCQ